jgi:hypothetical protein
MEADLFIVREPEPASARKGSAPEGTGRQRVVLECGFCGRKGGAYVEHYDLVRCGCGHLFWALQRRRSEPLMLLVHPEDEVERAA